MEKIIPKPAVHAVPIVGALAVILALAGCATTAPANDAGRIPVVASTSVYGDIATQVGGGRVSVTSIISNPSQDPHSFEADAQVQLALSKAAVVIENGGGYDPFVGTLLNGANNSSASVLNVATLSGYDQKPTTGQFNEHLWYDIPTVRKLVSALTATLSAKDPSGASAFAANAARFTRGLGLLQTAEATIKTSFAGAPVAITEPVPLYLLDACGLVNKTPERFSRAIEAGTDVSPLVLEQTLSLFRGHAVKLLAYNEQTSGPETEAVLAAARKAGVPVVPVRETLPAGQTYLSWMTSLLDQLKAALG